MKPSKDGLEMLDSHLGEGRENTLKEPQRMAVIKRGWEGKCVCLWGVGNDRQRERKYEGVDGMGEGKLV